MNKLHNHKTYKVKAPAKVNIGLRVLKKRQDGYHDIETIFYPLKRLFDEITIKIKPVRKKTNLIKVRTRGYPKINNKKNICYKAVQNFIDAFKPEDNYLVDIFIDKKIPVGAGLGGGSSDAAAVLKTLEKHFRSRQQITTPKQKNLLMKIAPELGSDVPFFIQGKTAYASGRGEKLKLLKDFKITGKILIVNPGIHISTPLAYRELKVKGVKAAILNNIKRFDQDNQRFMINDFEKVIFPKYPTVEKIKYGMITQGAKFALMSGSGSTVYGIFPPGKIKAAENYFRKKSYKVFTA